MQGTSNLAIATRTMMDKSWKKVVSFKSPLLTRLLERKQFTAGTQFEQIMQMDDYATLAQEYGPNDPTTGGRKDIMAKAKWNVAFIRTPLEKTIDEEIMNAPKGDHQLINLAKIHSKLGLSATKQKILHRIFSCAADAEIDEDHTYVQGIPSALLSRYAYENHPNKDNIVLTDDLLKMLDYYGRLNRTEDRNRMWRSADDENIFTEYNLSKSLFDEWIDYVTEFGDASNEDLLILMAPKLWTRTKRLIEASGSYALKGTVEKQGFDSMEYNNVEIAKDMPLGNMTSSGYSSKLHKLIQMKSRAGTPQGLAGPLTVPGTNGNNYMFILNLNTWNIRYWENKNEQITDGAFEVQDFFDQSKVKGGTEQWLAHIKFRGNVTCEAPCLNLMRGNVY